MLFNTVLGIWRETITFKAVELVLRVLKKRDIREQSDALVLIRLACVIIGFQIINLGLVGFLHNNCNVTEREVSRVFALYLDRACFGGDSSLCLVSFCISDRLVDIDALESDNSIHRGRTVNLGADLLTHIYYCVLQVA